VNSQQLRLFLAVARERNFTRAAASLYLTQSAVSQQIDAFEREHGVRLFERLPRAAVLTDAGTALLPYAERVVQLVDDAANALAAVRGVARGRLRVGASQTPATYLLPDLLGAFARNHPAVDVVLEVNVSAAIAEAVAAGALPLGVVEGVGADPRISIEPLLEDELLLVTPPDFAPAGPMVTLAELAALRYLAREQGAFTRELVDTQLLRLGLDWQPAMELGHIEAIKRAVASGLGAAFLSRHAVQAEAALGWLRLWRVEQLDLRRPWYLLRRAATHDSPAAAAFATLLRDQTATSWPA
jgi:LysR family transcriptional regulator, transcriptional activator of the cysJI operon